MSCNSHSVSLKQPPARVERRGLEQLAPDRRVKVRVRARIRARLSSTALVSGYIIRVRVKRGWRRGRVRISAARTAAA